MTSSLPDISFLRFGNSPIENPPRDTTLDEAKITSIYKRYPDLEPGSDVISSRNVSNSISKVQDEFEALKSLTRLLLEAGNYTLAAKTLQQFSNQTHFMSQPSTLQDFADNKYLELLFYQYAVYIQQVWFDRGKPVIDMEKGPPAPDYSSRSTETSGLSKLFGKSEHENTSGGVSVGTTDVFPGTEYYGTSAVSVGKTSVPDNSIVSATPLFVNPNTIFKKAVMYFAKCNTFTLSKKQYQPTSMSNFNTTSSSTPGGREVSEIQYFFLLSLLRLTEYFRRGEYFAFYTEFVSLLGTEPVCGIRPEDVLLDVQCRYTLKRDLVVMFGISLALALPFKDLSFLNSREKERTRNLIIDLFTLDSDGSSSSNLSISIYQLLVELSESRLLQAKEIINNKSFTDSVKAQLDHILNVNKVSSINFFDFFKQTIELKVFLMIITHIKRIPRRKLLSILGYKVEEYDSVTESLLALMSCLNLGESGIGYDVVGDYFFSEGQTNRAGLLREHVDQVALDLKGDAIAELVYGALVERYISTSFPDS